MKKTIVVSLALLLTIGFACKKSNSSSAYTPSCTGTTPKFSANVSSLIQSSCAKSGCHAGGSSNGPGALTSYSQVKNAAASIRTAIVNGTMPQNGSLSTDQRNTIVCWIDAGANND